SRIIGVLDTDLQRLGAQRRVLRHVADELIGGDPAAGEEGHFGDTRVAFAEARDLAGIAHGLAVGAATACGQEDQNAYAEKLSHCRLVVVYRTSSGAIASPGVPLSNVHAICFVAVTT